MINEQTKEQIRMQAKSILDNFSKSLDKVKTKKKEFKKAVGGYRKEGDGQKGDIEFREVMFANAPEKDEDCIIAEKKKW